MNHFYVFFALRYPENVLVLLQHTCQHYTGGKTSYSDIKKQKQKHNMITLEIIPKLKQKHCQFTS